MNISSRSHYALQLMTDLCTNFGGTCISLSEIAARQSISKKYLEQIVPSLTRAGLLLTVRGKQGGYKPAAPAEKITVYDVVSASEGNAEIRDSDSVTGYVWDGLEKAAEDYLKGISIRDIIDRSQNLQDYVI